MLQMKVLKKNSSNNNNNTNAISNEYTIVNTNDIISNINNRSVKITWSNIRVELPLKKNTSILNRFKKKNTEENRKIIIDNGSVNIYKFKKIK
jgi:hypothetical protein